MAENKKFCCHHTENHEKKLMVVKTMIDEIKHTGRADDARCEAKNREFYRFYMFVQKILE